MNNQRPFIPSRKCSYSEHARRIEIMLAEGLHDGLRWLDEAHARYAELEKEDVMSNLGVKEEEYLIMAKWIKRGNLYQDPTTSKLYIGKAALNIQRSRDGQAYNNQSEMRKVNLDYFLEEFDIFIDEATEKLTAEEIKLLSVRVNERLDTAIQKYRDRDS